MNFRAEARKSFQEFPLPELRYSLKTSMHLDEFSFDNFKYEFKDVDVSGYEDYFCSLVKDENKFVAFNRAFLQDVKIVHAKENEHVVEIVELDKPVSSVLIIGESGSKVDVEIHNSKGDYLISTVVECFVKDDAEVNVFSFQSLKDSYHFITKKGVVSRNGKLNWLDCCLGGKFVVSDVESRLFGEGSSSNNYGVFFGDKKQKFNLSAKAVHQGRNTKSEMFTKGVLDDEARSIYRGLIKIEKGAFNSSGYQTENTLLLSENAQADAIPDLEIDNNDVSCSHGATIGPVDKNVLFYLMSRGLTEKESINIIVSGFVEGIINRVSEKNKEKIVSLIDEKLK